jgi:hypothetical protein
MDFPGEWRGDAKSISEEVEQQRWGWIALANTSMPSVCGICRVYAAPLLLHCYGCVPTTHSQGFPLVGASIACDVRTTNLVERGGSRAPIRLTLTYSSLDY